MQKRTSWLVSSLVIILALVLIGGAFLAPFALPPKLAPEAYSPRELSTDESTKLRLQIDTRKSVIDWLQIIFTALTAGGLIGTLVYTARSYRVASDTLRVTESSRFSDAYLKSVELLGSGKPDTIVGAIHALGRLARSSCHDHHHVMTVLRDYVCRTAPHRLDYRGQVAQPAMIKPELQAVLDVLRTRKADCENAQRALNLSGTCLSGGNLEGGNLRFAILEDCDLRGTNLKGADLRDAQLRRTLLNNAVLDGADLRGANLQNTNLDSARLVSVRLRGATLKGATGTVTGARPRLSCQQKREHSLQWVM